MTRGTLERAWNAVRIARGDNVAVALRDIEGKARIRAGDAVLELVLAEPIRMGHKFALRDLPAGTEVVKYGSPIGIATHPITAGRHVHIHNLVSQRAGGKPRP